MLLLCYWGRVRFAHQRGVGGVVAVPKCARPLNHKRRVRPQGFLNRFFYTFLHAELHYHLQRPLGKRRGGGARQHRKAYAADKRAAAGLDIAAPLARHERRLVAPTTVPLLAPPGDRKGDTRALLPLAARVFVLPHVVDGRLQVGRSKHRRKARRRAAGGSVLCGGVAPKLIPRRGLVQREVRAIASVQHRVVDADVFQRQRHGRDDVKKVQKVEDTKYRADNKRHLAQLVRVGAAEDGKKQQRKKPRDGGEAYEAAQ